MVWRSFFDEIFTKIKISMKKTPLVLLLVGLSYHVFAQLTFSPVVAISRARAITNRSEYSTDGVFRYALGIQPVYHFDEKKAIGLGLQLTTKGHRGSTTGFTLGEEVRYQYLEANPFFEYRPVKFLGIVAGGNIAYLNSVEAKYGGKWQEPVHNFLFMEKWDLQLLGGLRYYVRDAFVGLSFSQSILPFEKLYFTDENGNPVFSLKTYYQSLSLSLGYNFHLKKK